MTLKCKGTSISFGVYTSACIFTYICMYVFVCLRLLVIHTHFFYAHCWKSLRRLFALLFDIIQQAFFSAFLLPLLLQPASKQWHAHNISEMLACFVGWLREFIQFICIFNSDSIATFAWIALNVKITQNTCSTFAGPPLSLLLWLLLLLTLVRLKAHNALHVRLSHCSGSP